MSLDESTKNIPSSDEFKDAFQSIFSNMPEKYLLMLKVHYRMPDRTITPSQLAEAVGYPNHRAASMQYGRLAQLIGQTINFPPPKKWIDILVKPYIHHGDDYGWIMHDQVAQALEYLNLT